MLSYQILSTLSTTNIAGMPNGYGSTMRIFTELTQVPFSFLREEKLESVIYVDDPYLQGDTYEECCLNIATTVKLLGSFGYTIRMQRNWYLDNFQFIPSQQIIFLGFFLDSFNKTLILT